MINDDHSKEHQRPAVRACRLIEARGATMQKGIQIYEVSDRCKHFVSSVFLVFPHSGSRIVDLSADKTDGAPHNRRLNASQPPSRRAVPSPMASSAYCEQVGMKRQGGRRERCFSGKSARAREEIASRLLLRSPGFPHTFKTRAQLAVFRPTARVRATRASSSPCAKPASVEPENFPQTAADAVAHHGVSELCAHRHAEAVTPPPVRADVDHKVR